eukprot:m.289156 g.289156  ORF g.289156 m.289156 type:complete len:316 (-) comp12085_c0_seq1:1009-1956(-)
MRRKIRKKLQALFDKVVRQQLGSARANVLVSQKTLREKRACDNRASRGDALAKVCVGLPNLEQRSHRLAVGKGRQRCEHLHNGARHAPDVRLAAISFAVDDLGSHPVGRAMHRLESSERFDVLQALRGAKIGEFDIAILVRQDVGAFDVAMDYSVFVEIMETLQNLPRVLADNILAKCAVVSQPHEQRLARDVFHENGEVLRGPLGAVVAHDSLVLQILEQCNLHLQGADLLDVFGMRLVRVQLNLLDGQLCARVQVQSAVDLPKGAAAKELAALPPFWEAVASRRKIGEILKVAADPGAHQARVEAVCVARIQR